MWVWISPKGQLNSEHRYQPEARSHLKKKKKKKHAQHGIVFFKEVISSHGEHREKQAFGWNCFESGLCVPCLLVGRSHKYSWGIREEGFERYNCVWGLTSYNSLKRKKNLGIHLKKISNNECRNTRDSSPGEGAVPTTSWLLWTSNGMKVFLLSLRRFCAVLKKSINHFSKFCCVISSQECACVC